MLMAVTADVGTPHIHRGRQSAWEVRDGRDHTGQEHDRAAHGGFLRREHGAEPLVHERQTFERAGQVLAAARKAGIFVTYCISHFRPGYPEIPAQHNLRSPMRATGAVLPADPALLIHPSVAPRRVSPSSPSTAPVRSPAARLTPS